MSRNHVLPSRAYRKCLVPGAGRRSTTGFTSNPGGATTKLLFVAAIPEAMNNDYLRILGAISRVCREEASLQALLNAEKKEAFLAALEKGCLQ